ncbi:hypothetical protein pb186bvf_007620 [Paramecium bursaria]
MNKKAKLKEEKIKSKKLKQDQRESILKQLKQIQLAPQQMESLKSVKDSTSSNLKKEKKLSKPKSLEQVEEEPQDAKKMKINIFQTELYENENAVEQKRENFNSVSKMSESERLEIETKKFMPELNLNTFNGKKEQIQHKFYEQHYDLSKDDIYDLVQLTEDQLFKDNLQYNHKQLQRDEIIQKQRQQLPILKQENEIIDTIRGNLITLISGETGCGKSTQIPQFLYEAGFTDHGALAITQPRRLAAISLAQRVSEETGFQLGEEICYQVKHQSTKITDKMQMKFMTDGILLNELQSSALLPQYSVILIDEAHERKVNIDILIGVLSRIVIIRSRMNMKPLRLVIMSATLRLDDFLENKRVFPRQLNVINIQSRQYPVKVYYEKQTKENYIDTVVEKCVKIHQKLPPGDILIFLTGQAEIKQCCSQIENKLNQLRYSNEENQEISPQESMEEEVEYQDEEKQKDQDLFDKNQYQELKNMVGNKSTSTVFQYKNQLKDFIIYPLYSKLDMSQQQQIFKNDPTQTRMIVVSTNVAETSITIPTIRYVIDSGKQKRKIVDNSIGLESQVISWISQASANQRSGRAGRTGLGYCYRLYSTAVYSNIFRKFDEPEITEIPLESIILQLKSIGIQDIYKFPFLTQPDNSNIQNGLVHLLKLKALEGSQQSKIDQTKITELGKVLATIPIAPKYGKLLLQSRAGNIFHYGIILVCVLGVEELINRNAFNIQISQSDDIDELIKQQREQNKNLKSFLHHFSYGQQKSDLICYINIVGELIKSLNQQDDINYQITQYALKNKLITKQLKEVYYNILQIMQIFSTILQDQSEYKKSVELMQSYTPPSEIESSQISKLIIQSNGIEKICRLVNIQDPIKQTKRYFYQSKGIEESFIHQSSIFHEKMIEFISYNTVLDQGIKKFVTNITKVDDIELLYNMDDRAAYDKKLQIDKSKAIYDNFNDNIMCYASANIAGLWNVENFLIEYPKDQLGLYSCFARLLLEGQIIEFFKPLNKYYLQKVQNIKESNLELWSQQIIKAFMIQKISSKAKLMQQWKSNPKYFLSEFLKIVQDKYHKLIISKWPPIFFDSQIKNIFFNYQQLIFDTTIKQDKIHQIFQQQFQGDQYDFVKFYLFLFQIQKCQLRQTLQKNIIRSKNKHNKNKQQCYGNKEIQKLIKQNKSNNLETKKSTKSKNSPLKQNIIGLFKILIIQNIFFIIYSNSRENMIYELENV